MKQITTLLSDPNVNMRIDGVWNQLSEDFEQVYASMPVKFMQRAELSFHSYVKLLGFLCIELAPLEADIVEIGVWKGKSLALMQRLVQPPTKVIGIDPCDLQGQADELGYFHLALFPDSFLVRKYSEIAIEETLGLSDAFKLLHIDGGHASFNVWLDFLVYERFVVPGGCIVFDDYMDSAYSPEVGPTIDRMRRMGIFKDYHVIGSVPNYENSYLLLKK
jgi:SAM-dependent methyltransferase